MSAQNWTTCPACELRAEAENDLRAKAAKDAYGKVSEEEYEKLRDRASDDAVEELEETFREKYELAIGHNKRGPHMFFVVYSGECQSCGFSHSFEHYDDLAKEVKDKASEDDS